jgi:hypothetical protein
MSIGQNVMEVAQQALHDAGLDVSNKTLRDIVNDNKDITGYESDYINKPPVRGDGGNDYV